MPVPSTIVDISTTASSNSPAGSDLIGNTLDEYLRAIQGILKTQFVVGADIASATTITPTADGYYFNVTGTTTITTIASTNSWNGRLIVLKFAGALTLTHNASTLILPTATNITTVAGDVGFFVQESSGAWRCVYYTGSSTTLKVGRGTLPANTAALIDRLGTGTLPSLSAGTVLTLAGIASSSAPAYLQIISGNAATSEVRFGDTDAAYRGAIEYDHSGDFMRCTIAGAGETWRASSSNFLMGTTTAISPGSTTGEGFNFSVSGATTAVMSRSANPVLQLQRTTSDGAIQTFNRQTTQVGSISVTTTNTSYNTSSDYRLPWKIGYTPIENSGEFIDSLKPYYFPIAKTGGFIAHEFGEVSPLSVTGDKDMVDEEGNPIYQSMQASSADVMANLVAEIQSLRKRVKELENAS